LYRVSVFRKFFWEGWADGRAEKAGRIERAGASVERVRRMGQVGAHKINVKKFVYFVFLL